MQQQLLTVVHWNLQADGGEQPVAEWEGAHEILADLKPDVLMRSELKHSRSRGHQRLHAAENRLGLRGMISARNPWAPEAADIATAVFVRPEMVDIVEDRPVTEPWWLHPTHVTVRLRDCTTPVHLVSYHHCFYEPQIRAMEARWLTTLASPGAAVLAAGDANSYACCSAVDRERLPDWARVTDTAHREHRARYSDGRWVSDTEPDRILHAAGFHDPALSAAERLGQPEALNPTAGYRRVDQGGPQRIDRHYHYGIGPETLVSFVVLDNPETRRVSDHAVTVATYDYATLASSLGRTVPAAQGASA